MGTFFYMLLAFLVGVLVGWFIWGRLRGEFDSLRGDMDRTRSERDRLRADADRLTGELEVCRGARADLERQLSEVQGSKTGATKAAIPAPSALMATSAPAKSTPAKTTPAKNGPAKTAPAKTASKKPAAAKAAAAPKAGASKAGAPKASAPKPPASKTGAAPKSAAPAARKAATRKAAPDKASNLRRLIGIGPANERLLNELGVTTFAQIAAWTAADVKRIEETLNFDGRIERERWIEQAKLLAAGDEEEFARRFPTGGTASNT
ncbi:MAG: proton-conducting membrane transporter [Mesorhizobium sp.]|uniref:proton-conducting membrane transporter n=1 Tax=unclassified Mesorhizobium TaxID=325217 RepID=UPI000FCBC0D5|nr:MULTISPECIES: proton-conducting membrane transporter [unclassified Mesorhizobium]RUV70151.1 proton-conducting membrane transporter [Mesorhizobium sp. M5C.F.Cr.IN.023.01.1.1]RWF86127.1 MAG: proton-conducting membrane transporter [Mesorhizobium sp.]RWF94226.1 MAG: proton-conducting membrane transporter [Mesorhizobium sp.]RWI34727.1 MAG: proton-conducting membrane transporter [Mesorhizobium sp.]RWI43977.1 MAG: proton-conducting membrane transporter [Mesorhizobium sp.]